MGGGKTSKGEVFDMQTGVHCFSDRSVEHLINPPRESKIPYLIHSRNITISHTRM